MRSLQSTREEPNQETKKNEIVANLTYFESIQPGFVSPHFYPLFFRCVRVGVLSPLSPAPHWLSTLCRNS